MSEAKEEGSGQNAQMPAFGYNFEQQTCEPSIFDQLGISNAEEDTTLDWDCIFDLPVSNNPPQPCSSVPVSVEVENAGVVGTTGNQERDGEVRRNASCSKEDVIINAGSKVSAGRTLPEPRTVQGTTSKEGRSNDGAAGTPSYAELYQLWQAQKKDLKSQEQTIRNMQSMMMEEQELREKVRKRRDEACAEVDRYKRELSTLTLAHDTLLRKTESMHKEISSDKLMIQQLEAKVQDLKYANQDLQCQVRKGEDKEKVKLKEDLRDQKRLVRKYEREIDEKISLIHQLRTKPSTGRTKSIDRRSLDSGHETESDNDLRHMMSKLRDDILSLRKDMSGGIPRAQSNTKGSLFDAASDTDNETLNSRSCPSSNYSNNEDCFDSLTVSSGSSVASHSPMHRANEILRDILFSKDYSKRTSLFSPPKSVGVNSIPGIKIPTSSSDTNSNPSETFRISPKSVAVVKLEPVSMIDCKATNAPVSKSTRHPTLPSLDEEPNCDITSRVDAPQKPVFDTGVPLSNMSNPNSTVIHTNNCPTLSDEPMENPVSSNVVAQSLFSPPSSPIGLEACCTESDQVQQVIQPSEQPVIKAEKTSSDGPPGLLKSQALRKRRLSKSNSVSSQIISPSKKPIQTSGQVAENIFRSIPSSPKMAKQNISSSSSLSDSDSTSGSDFAPDIDEISENNENHTIAIKQTATLPEVKIISPVKKYESPSNPSKSPINPSCPKVAKQNISSSSSLSDSDSTSGSDSALDIDESSENNEIALKQTATLPEVKIISPVKKHENPSNPPTNLSCPQVAKQNISSSLALSDNASTLDSDSAPDIDESSENNENPTIALKETANLPEVKITSPVKKCENPVPFQSTYLGELNIKSPVHSLHNDLNLSSDDSADDSYDSSSSDDEILPPILKPEVLVANDPPPNSKQSEREWNQMPSLELSGKPNKVLSPGRKDVSEVRSCLDPARKSQRESKNLVMDIRPTEESNTHILKSAMRLPNVDTAPLPEASCVKIKQISSAAKISDQLKSVMPTNKTEEVASKCKSITKSQSSVLPLHNSTEAKHVTTQPCPTRFMTYARRRVSASRGSEIPCRTPTIPSMKLEKRGGILDKQLGTALAVQTKRDSSQLDINSGFSDYEVHLDAAKKTRVSHFVEAKKPLDIPSSHLSGSSGVQKKDNTLNVDPVMKLQAKKNQRFEKASQAPKLNELQKVSEVFKPQTKETISKALKNIGEVSRPETSTTEGATKIKRSDVKTVTSLPWQGQVTCGKSGTSARDKIRSTLGIIAIGSGENICDKKRLEIFAQKTAERRKAEKQLGVTSALLPNGESTKGLPSTLTATSSAEKSFVQDGSKNINEKSARSENSYKKSSNSRENAGQKSPVRPKVPFLMSTRTTPTRGQDFQSSQSDDNCSNSLTARKPTVSNDRTKLMRRLGLKCISVNKCAQKKLTPVSKVVPPVPPKKTLKRKSSLVNSLNSSDSDVSDCDESLSHAQSTLSNVRNEGSNKSSFVAADHSIQSLFGDAEDESKSDTHCNAQSTLRNVSNLGSSKSSHVAADRSIQSLFGDTEDESSSDSDTGCNAQSTLSNVSNAASNKSSHVAANHSIQSLFGDIEDESSSDSDTECNKTSLNQPDGKNKNSKSYAHAQPEVTHVTLPVPPCPIPQKPIAINVLKPPVEETTLSIGDGNNSTNTISEKSLALINVKQRGETQSFMEEKCLYKDISSDKFLEDLEAIAVARNGNYSDKKAAQTQTNQVVPLVKLMFAESSRQLTLEQITQEAEAIIERNEPPISCLEYSRRVHQQLQNYIRNQYFTKKVNEIDVISECKKICEKIRILQSLLPGVYGELHSATVVCFIEHYLGNPINCPFKKNEILNQLGVCYGVICREFNLQSLALRMLEVILTRRVRQKHVFAHGLILAFPDLWTMPFEFSSLFERSIVLSLVYGPSCTNGIYFKNFRQMMIDGCELVLPDCNFKQVFSLIWEELKEFEFQSAIDEGRRALVMLLLQCDWNQAGVIIQENFEVIYKQWMEMKISDKIFSVFFDAIVSACELTTHKDPYFPAKLPLFQNISSSLKGMESCRDVAHPLKQSISHGIMRITQLIERGPNPCPELRLYTIEEEQRHNEVLAKVDKTNRRRYKRFKRNEAKREQIDESPKD